MKALKLIIIFIACSSCQKKQTWICEDAKITTNYDFQPPKVVTDKTSYSKNNMTEKEIRKFEQENYKIEEILDDSGKVRVTVENKITCQ